MKQFDKVKFNTNYTRIINDTMKSYIEDNKDRIYKIERIIDDTVKLYKVDFWITKDLLIMI